MQWKMKNDKSFARNLKFEMERGKEKTTIRNRNSTQSRPSFNGI